VTVARRARSIPSLGSVIAGGLVVLMVTASLLVGGAGGGPGMVLVAVGLGTVLLFSGLNSPVLAVVLLLLTLCFRVALADVLPVEPFILVFGVVIAAAWIAVARGSSWSPKLGPVEVVMTFYAAWNIGSAIAPHPYPAIDPVTGTGTSVYHYILTGTLLPFTLYLLGRFLFHHTSAVRTLLWTVVGIAGYSTLVSIAQFHAPALVWPRYIVEDSPDQWVGRAIGVFGQPVLNGLVLVVGFAVAQYLAHQPRTPRWQRVTLWVIAITSVYAIYLTYTRVAWLAFAITLVLGAVLLPRSRRAFVAAIVAVIVAIGVNWSTFISEDRTAGGVGSPDEVSDRLNMIATAWWALQERPLAGWGIGRFTAVNTYHHQRWSQEVDWRRGYADSAHFNELGIAAELGVVGLVLWLAVLVLVGRRLVQGVATVPRDWLCGHGLVVLGLIAFVGWILTGLTVDLRFLDFGNALVMLLAGLAVGQADRHAAARDPGSDAETGPAPQLRHTEPAAVGQP